MLGQEPWGQPEYWDEGSAANAWAAAAYELCIKTSCRHVLFTDAITSVAFRIRDPSVTDVHCYRSKPEDPVARFMAGVMLRICEQVNIVRPSLFPPIRPYQNEHGPFPIGPVPPITCESRANFSDWTREDMESQKKDFLDWTRKLVEHGEDQTRRRGGKVHPTLSQNFPNI